MVSSLLERLLQILLLSASGNEWDAPWPKLVKRGIDLTAICWETPFCSRFLPCVRLALLFLVLTRRLPRRLLKIIRDRKAGAKATAEMISCVFLSASRDVLQSVIWVCLARKTMAKFSSSITIDSLQPSIYTC